MAFSEIEKSPKKFAKVRWQTLVGGLGIVLALLFLTTLLLAYALPSHSSQIRTFRSHLPYPIAIFGYRGMVSIQELAENISAVRRFYESQDFSQVGLRVDFSTEEGEKRLKIREKEVLNKMLEDRAIELLAKKRGIRITEEMARNGLLRSLEEYGSEAEVKENLARLYGWSLDDFQKKIVLPSLYEEKLMERFSEEVDVRTRAETRISQAAEALSQKKSFSDVAGEFSEGETADQGGELGWFTISELAPELRSAVTEQTLDKPGGIVESDLGFHILLVNEKKVENSENLYRLSQIFVRKKLFADWLTEQMRTLSIFVWSPDYRYNPREARVEFRTEDMRDFEKKILEESNGDPVFSF